MTEGITTDTVVTIDWDKLGAHLAKAGSDEQAEFLHGFAKQLLALGTVDASHQIGYIAGELRHHYMQDAQPPTSWVFEELAVAL